MSKARIVVVEDEGLVALQIKEGLISAGYDVPAIAASGKEAMKIIADTEPDLVLMDIHLKGSMDGIQTADKIKEIYDIPVIYLTAYSDDDTVKRAKNTEPYGYILKPVSERSLELAIEMTLQKAKKEKQLKVDADWYSSIIKGIGQGIIVISLKGVVKFINPFAEKLTGWNRDMAINRLYKEVFSLFTSDSTPVEIPFDEIILENKIIKEMKCLLRSKDNSEVPVIYSLIPLQNQNKNTIGIIMLLSYLEEDITLTYEEESVPVHDPGVTISLFPESGQLIQGIRVHWFRKPDPNPSGDSFNVFALGKDYTGFYIFDVSFYGLSAALFSHNLNQYLFPNPELGGIVTQGDGEEKFIVPPVEVVKELNKRFFFEEKENPFFTIIYGVINTRDGRTRIVRAGHPYPIYQDNSGNTVIIKSEGGPVGMFSDIHLTEYELELKPGNRLFLYSDGLIDSSFADMNEDAFVRLITFIENNAESDLDRMILNIKQEETMWHKNIAIAAEIAFVVLQRE